MIRTDSTLELAEALDAILFLFISVYSRFIAYFLVVGDTSNFHFDTIPSSLGISIDGIEYNTDTS